MITAAILLLIFVLLLAAQLLYFRIAARFNIIDKPNLRSSHTQITLRGGGIIFYIGMLLYSLFFPIDYPFFLLGLTLISTISFVDDLKPLNYKPRLIVHLMAMMLMFMEWGMVDYPWWYALVAWVICTGILNAYNFMDGINGITGGYSLVLLGSLIYVNTQVVAFIAPSFLYVAFLSVIVFNLFNFRKRAKCFAGDIGAFSIAFITLFALGMLIIETQRPSYLLFLAVYGVDAVLTIIHRIMLKENITNPHRKHAYQLMANELKITHLRVSSFYALLQLVISAGLIYFQEHDWVYGFVVLLLLSGLYIWFKRRYFYLHRV